MERDSKQVRNRAESQMIQCPGCGSENVFLISLEAREGGRSQISKYKCLDCKARGLNEKWEVRG